MKQDKVELTVSGKTVRILIHCKDETEANTFVASMKRDKIDSLIWFWLEDDVRNKKVG